MNMKKYIAILAAAALILSSCEKQFEVQDTSSLSGSSAAALVENDPNFLASYINGFYAWMVQFNQAGNGQHDDYGHLGLCSILDLMGLDVAVSGSWNWGTYDINHDYGAYTWVRPYMYWNCYYTLIKKCNEVIDFFGEEDPENDTLRGYLGQAYALRAFSYTYLIQIFQDVASGTYPNATFRTDAPAVPIVYAVRDAKTTEETEAVSGRNTMAELMAEIERNIELALPLLKGYDRAGDKNQVNFQVAQGIAARYYLLTQQWEKAASAAQAAQIGFDIMTPARLYEGFMEINDAEVMWGFNHSTETQTAYASFFSHLSNESAGYGGIGQSVHCIDRSLYDMIPATDYRKKLFNNAEGDPTALQVGGQYPYASRKFGYADSWLQDYTFMRNSEMVLIEAEAYARLGNGGQAATVLGKLMSQRDPSWNSSNVTVEDVLLQRRIELWGEGFSYFDLRRNGLGVDRRYEGTNHSAAAQYAFVAHQPSWNFQIPQREMQNNSNITEDEQNDWISGTAPQGM